MTALAFYRDVLTAGATLDLPAGPNRVLFGWQGKVTIRAAGTVTTLSTNSAWHGAMAATATAGRGKVTLAGVLRVVVSPRPSWPLALLPQA